MHFGRGDSVWVWCVCMCNVMFPSCIFCQQVQTVVSTYLTGVRKNGGAFHIPIMGSGLTHAVGMLWQWLTS